MLEQVCVAAQQLWPARGRFPGLAHAQQATELAAAVPNFQAVLREEEKEDSGALRIHQAAHPAHAPVPHQAQG